MKIPGFVDLQVNGFMGIDFSSPDLTEDQFLFACKELISRGTVVFLPTLITSSIQTYKRNLALISRLLDQVELKANVPGIHLEGPFISADEGAIGAHNPKWVREPDTSLLDELYGWSRGKIMLLTIAAELPGAEVLCRHAIEMGITVSLGHQMALEADLDRLVSAGARSFTHLGNALPALLPRHNNPLWAGIANDELMAMVIADGYHLPPSVLKAIIRTKGVSNVIAVSDASPISGLPPGRYHTLGNDVILEESGLLHNPKTGYMVGSSVTMIDCMNYLASLNFVEKTDLYDMGFYNPLRLINIDPEEILDNLPVTDVSVSLSKNGQFFLPDKK